MNEEDTYNEDEEINGYDWESKESDDNISLWKKVKKII